MNARDKAEDLLRQFGETVGVEGIGFDSEGAAVVTFDGLFVLFGVSEADGALLVTTALPGSEGPKSPALLEELLIANAHWQGTDGATLAIDGPDGPVILQRRLQLADLRYQDFDAMLGGFVNSATALAAHVEVERASYPVSEEVEPPKALDDMITFRA